MKNLRDDRVPQQDGHRLRFAVRRSAVLGSVATVAVVSLAACGTSGSASSNSSSSSSASSSGSGSGSSTGSALKLNSSGVPNLSGEDLPLGKGAGAPHVGDTVSYTAEQLLKKWDASTQLTLGEGSAVVADVAGGHLVATGGPEDAELNGGLVLFGPSQPGQDYQFIVHTGTLQFPALKGKVLAVSAPNVGDAVLTTLLLKKYGMTKSDVTIEYSGTEDNSLAGFIAGRVQGFWASSDSIVALRQKHIGFHVLMAARTLAPYEADSYEAASPSWIKSHFAQAEAIDLAWLYAANIFNTNEKLWSTYAASYTEGSVPAGTIALDYKAYKSGSLFPTTSDAFSPSNVKQNVMQDIQNGGITKLGSNPSESQYADFGPWNAAVAAFEAHPNAAG